MKLLVVVALLTLASAEDTEPTVSTVIPESICSPNRKLDRILKDKIAHLRELYRPFNLEFIAPPAKAMFEIKAVELEITREKIRLTLPQCFEGVER